MEQNLSNKEYFDKTACKAVQEGKFDFIRIVQQGATAILNYSEKSRIREAIVTVKIRGKWQEWIVEDYQVKQCSEPLHICIKNLKILVGCIGSTEDENSYFKIKNIDNTAPQEITIFGIIEIGECTCAFYVDAETKENYYIYQDTDRNEHTDLFSIIKNVKIMEDLRHEYETIHGGRLAEEETSTKLAWADSNQWQG